jgi:AraC-like DNA-binding protein/predicted nucleic acid-binding protein
MRELEKPSRPCFSLRLVLPFARLLRRYPEFPRELLVKLEALDPDQRLPIVTVHELLSSAIEITGDPDIGLKAAREITSGDYGALEYAARSAATWGEACEAVGRYMRLVNDALHFSLRREGERAIIRLDSDVALPRASEDFQLGAFHISASHFWPHGAVPEIDVWFTHPKPENTQEYERTFVGAVIHFDSPFSGFAMATHYLELPVESGDPKLHVVIRKHAEALMAELPRAQSLTQRARDLIAKQLEGGTPSIEHIARELSIGERTLGRRLRQEGTTFRELLDDLRRRLALRHVGDSDLALSEIAFLLGFSQSAAFHRAFKRWTSQTPLEYRRARRP